MDPQTTYLIDSLANEGYTYVDTVAIPYGFDNTLIWGNTNRNKKGIFHRKKFEPKTMNIKGWEFEKKELQWTSHQRFYRFDFMNKTEEAEFVAFQNYCENYQSHGKTPVHFFKIDSIWYMQYQPMP